MVYSDDELGENVVSRSISDNLKEQLNSQESGDPFLLLVTITHASFGSIRFVNNIDDVISRGETYFAFPIKIVLPVDDGETTPIIKMTLDNVSLELIDELRSVTTPAQVTVEAILASAPDFVEIGYDDLTLGSIQYNQTTITANLTFDDILNTTIPSEKYEPDNFPGIF